MRYKCATNVSTREKQNSQNSLFMGVLRVVVEVPGEPQCGCFIYFCVLCEYWYKLLIIRHNIKCYKDGIVK